jgi:hypothetical protein
MKAFKQRKRHAYPETLTDKPCAFGRAWSIRVFTKPGRDYTKGATAYNYAAPGFDKPHYPMPAIQTATIDYHRAYGTNHGPMVTCVTLWETTHCEAYAQWTWEENADHGTYWSRDMNY